MQVPITLLALGCVLSLFLGIVWTRIGDYMEDRAAAVKRVDQKLDQLCVSTADLAELRATIDTLTKTVDGLVELFEKLRARQS